MERKTYFIIFGSILAVVALAFIFYFILAKKQGAPENQPTDQSSVTLPAETPANAENIQRVQKIIESTIQEPISKQSIQGGFKIVNLNDQNRDQIPFTDFEKAAGITINQKLRSHLDNKENYDLFYCPGANGEKDFGLYLGDDMRNNYGNIYSDSLIWMKDWEKTMLHDLHTVLFPYVNFSESELDKNLDFKNGKYKYAEIQLPGGRLSSINYEVVSSGVIITASPSCLDNMIQYYEPLEP